LDLIPGKASGAGISDSPPLPFSEEHHRSCIFSSKLHVMMHSSELFKSLYRFIPTEICYGINSIYRGEGKGMNFSTSDHHS